MANINYQSNTLPPDYAIEQQKLDRARQLAQAMQTQSQQPMPQGQMVSGRYVAPSPLEGVNKLLGAYLSNRQMNDADTKQADLTKRYNTDRAAVLAQALQAREGTPEMPGAPLPQDVQGPVQPTTAVPGSTRKMAEVLLGSQFPDLQQTGMQQALTQDEVVKLSEGERAFMGGKEIFSNPKVREHVVEGQIFRDQGQGYTPVAGEKKVPDYKDPEYLRIKKEIAAAGRPLTNVNVSTEKKYGEQFASNVAKADVDMRDAAIKSPELAQRANNIKELLASGKVITGTGADFRLALGKAAGLVGLSDKETIANTEAVSVDLARNTIDSIKASGLGSGSGFSNADRDFLEKAAGGKITLEAATLDRLATLAHKAAQGSAGRWNTRVKEIPQSALEGTGIKQDAVNLPELYSPKRRATDNQQVNPKIDDLLKKYGQ